MEDIKWCPQHGYPLPCAKCGMPSIESQREIFEKGRQAGKKEVVEWMKQYAQTDLLVDERDKPIPFYCFDDIVLNTKLKDWGIDGK